MELDVLQVDAARAGAIGHGDAVAARARRIRRVQKNAAEAARRQNSFLGENGENFPGGLVEHVRANAGQRAVNVGGLDRMVRRRQQVHRGGVCEHFHFRVSLDPLKKCPLNRKSGLVLEVNDARDGMAGLGSQIEFSRMFRRRIERNVKLVDQDFFHQARAFVAQQRSRFRRTESCAGRENVLHKLLGPLAVPAIDDPALRPIGVAVLGLVSAREQRDFAAALGGVPRRCQAAEAAADDENVGLDRSVHNKRILLVQSPIVKFIGDVVARLFRGEGFLLVVEKPRV